MLRAIRDGSQSILVRALLILIIAGFALWGVQGGGVGAPTPVAQVGDETVAQQRFLQRFQNEVALRQRDNEDYSYEQAFEEGLDRQILEQMMFAKTFDNVTASMGLRASDRQVGLNIRDIPSFNDVLGNFDKVAYDEELNRQGLTVKGFEEERRTELERSELVNALLSAAPVPSALVDIIYRQNLETRDIEFFEVLDRTIDVEDPSNEAMQAEYDANPDAYTSEEMRKLTYLTIQISDIINRIEVDDDQIAERYEDRRDTYETAETRDLQHLLIDDEADAQALYQRLVDGLSFADAATETGQLAAEVALDGFDREQASYLGEDAVEAAFALDLNAVSEPVESDLGGYVIFTVTNIDGGVTSTLEDVREQLRTDIALEEAEYQIIELSEQAQDLLSEDTSIEDVAKALNLSSRTVESLSPSGYNQYGNIVDGLPRSRAFFDSAFAKEPGEFDELEETGTGGYFVVRVDGITPPALKSYDDVKKDIRSNLRAAARDEAAAARAADLQAQANEDGALGDVSGSVGADIRVVAGLRRDGQSVPPSFSTEAVRGLFTAQEGDIFIAPNRTSDGYIVAQLTDIGDAAGEEDAAATAVLKNSLQDMMSNDLLITYQQYLSDDYPSEINFAIRAQLEEQLTE